MLKIMNVLCIRSGRKQAVLLALNNCVPLTVLCIAQYYAVMTRGEGSRYILLGARQPSRALGPTYIEYFFSDRTTITSTMHFFACLSDLCTLHTLFLPFVYVKSCVYEDQSRFGYDAELTLDIAASMFRNLTGLDEYSSS